MAIWEEGKQSNLAQGKTVSSRHSRLGILAKMKQPTLSRSRERGSSERRGKWRGLRREGQMHTDRHR
jgi:hypothetical protein